MSEIADQITAFLYEHQERALSNLDTGKKECRCGEQGGVDWRAHFAAVLASSFVVLPKDQLHRETRIAEVIKTEMHRNVPERMRLPGIPEWIDRAAAAVLASLELHQEWTVRYSAVGGQNPRGMDEKHARYVAEKWPESFTAITRLVGSWGPVTDSKEKQE